MDNEIHNYYEIGMITKSQRDRLIRKAKCNPDEVSDYLNVLQRPNTFALFLEWFGLAIMVFTSVLYVMRKYNSVPNEEWLMLIPFQNKMYPIISIKIDTLITGSFLYGMMLYLISC